MDDRRPKHTEMIFSLKDMNKEADKLSFDRVVSKQCENNKQIFIFKVAKTLCLLITWICMGLFSGITGPTLPDLSERLHVDYSRLGFAVACKSIGKMTGSLIFGYLRDRSGRHADLLLGCLLFLVAISVVTKPWVTTISLLAFLFFMEGLPHGGINSVGNSMCVLMWEKKAAMPIHFLHLGYGIGALLSPIIARPFLSDIKLVNQSQVNMTTRFRNMDSDIIKNNTNELVKIVIKTSQIEIPYAIVSGIIVVVGMAYFALYLNRSSRQLTTTLGRTSYSNPLSAPFLKDRPRTAVPILFLFFMFYMMNSLIDKSLSSFLFTYAVESDIGLNKNEAAYLNTAFFASYAAGRAIMGLLALKLPVRFIVFLEVYLMTASSAVITFYAYNKRVFLWVFSCLLAAFFGPIFPSGVAWVDRYVALYGLVVAIFDLGNGVGAFFANWMSGYLISHIGPHSLLYFNFIAACIMCVVIAIAQMVGRIRGDRYTSKAQNNLNDNDG